MENKESLVGTPEKIPGNTDDQLKLEIMNFYDNYPGSYICAFVYFQQFINQCIIIKKGYSWIALMLNFYQVDEAEGQLVKVSGYIDNSVVKIMDYSIQSRMGKKDKATVD